MIFTVAMIALAATWFARRDDAGSSGAPRTRLAADDAASRGASTFSDSDAAADAGRQPGAAVAPSIGSSGRLVDLGGKTVAQTVSRYAGDARRGDADAAWRVYLAESVCANTASPPADPTVCAHVSAAEVDERLRFLAQAARAGRGEARIDYFIEGPFGHGSGALGGNPDDPAVAQWRDEARDHLRDAAQACDPLAAGLLSGAYGNGTFGAQDPATAIGYALLAAAAGNAKWSRARLEARYGAQLSPDAFAAAYASGQQQAKLACANAR